MNSIRIINAIFSKQVNDIIKDIQVLILFIVYPVIALIMTSSIGKELGQTSFFIAIFATMHTIFTPIVATAAIISEEKEKNTLRCLIMANVKPYQYLISIGGFIFICTIISGSSFIFMGDFSTTEALKVMLSMGIGCICSIILGLTIGGYSKNMSSANSLAVPVGMVFSFLPMLSEFNTSIEQFAKFTYGQQISYIISGQDYNIGFLSTIIAINLIIFLVLFILTFKNNKLDN